MSAYNAYNKPVVQQQQSNILLDKYLDLQRLSHGSTQENYDLFTKKQHLKSLVFEKIQKGPSYPIGDGNVYTVDSDRKVEMTKMNNDQPSFLPPSNVGH
jgi:hypothetical protein